METKNWLSTPVLLRKRSRNKSKGAPVGARKCSEVDFFVPPLTIIIDIEQQALLLSAVPNGSSAQEVTLLPAAFGGNRISYGQQSWLRIKCVSAAHHFTNSRFKNPKMFWFRLLKINNFCLHLVSSLCDATHKDTIFIHFVKYMTKYKKCYSSRCNLLIRN